MLRNGGLRQGHQRLPLHGPVRPTVGQALALHPNESCIGTFAIVHAECDAGVVAELELGRVTVQVLPVTRVSGPHRLPICTDGGTVHGVRGWVCGARGAGPRSTSRTGSCAASSATAARPAG